MAEQLLNEEQENQGQEQVTEMPVEAPESAPETTSPESNANVAPQQYNVSEGVSVRIRPRKGSRIPNSPMMLEEAPTEGGVDLLEEPPVFQYQRNEAAEKEEVDTSISILASEGYTPPRTQQEAEVLKKAANDFVMSKKVGEARRTADMMIANSTTPEETMQAIGVLQRAQQGFVTFNELRHEELKQRYKPSSDVFLRSSDEIAANMRYAQFAQKAQDNLWDNTRWWDVAVDVLELVSPTAVISERMDKQQVSGGTSLWNYIDMGGSYEDLAEKLYNTPPEQREKVVRAMIDEIVAQETILFSNGNSLLQADQLSLLQATLEDGFSAFLGDTPTGGVMSGEIGERIFSAIDLLPVAGALAKSGGRGLLNALVRKVFPSEGGRTMAGARPRAGNRVDNAVAADPVKARREMNEKGSVMQEVEKSGLPDYATTSRFIPVQSTDEIATVPVVEYRGKLIPLHEAKKALEDVETKAGGKASRKVVEVDGKVMDYDEFLKTERGANLAKSGKSPRPFTPAEGLRLAIEKGVRYVPRNAVTAPKKAVDNSQAKTLGETVKDFDDRVDNGTPMSNSVDDQLEWSAPDPKRIEESFRDISQTQLIEPEAYLQKSHAVARRIETMTGSSLKHNPADTLWKANDQADSLGDFKIYFGDGDTGFETKEIAEAVGRTALGEDLKAVQKNGRWYLEKTFTHKFDPNKEVGVFNTARVTSANPLFAWFLNPLRKLGAANLSDIWGNIEVNRAVANNILKPAKQALKSLNGKEREFVGKMLGQGDEMQEVFTRQRVLEVFGRTVSDKEYDAYLKVRNVFDAHYDIINNNARKAMEREGYKSMTVGEDLTFGRILTKDQAKEMGQSVYDVNTKTVRSLDEVGDDEVLMFSHVRKQTDDGQQFNLVVGKPDDVSELPYEVIRKRVGHVTRTYQDRKWKVVQYADVTINGVTKRVPRTLGITRLEGEANDILTSLRSKEDLVDADLRVVRTVENPADDIEGFMDDMSNIGYMSSNARKRGSMLLGGVNNPARIADPLESMATAQNRIERELNRDVVRTLEQKFMNTWKDYLVNPYDSSKPLTSFPKEGGLVFKADTPAKVQKQIRNFHDYITTMNGVRQGKFAEYFNSAFTAIEEALYRSTGMKASKGIQKIIDSDVQRAFMKLATNAYIIGRPLFQIPTNLLQTMNIMIRYPVTGTKSAARALLVASALAGRREGGFSGLWKALGKTGYSDEELKLLLDMIDETGIVSTTKGVDDFLSLAEEGMKTAGMQTGMFGMAKKAGSAAAYPLKAALRASSKAQEASINYVNLVAFITEFDNALKNGVKMNAKGKADILNKARQLTQSQNSLDQFGYQQGHNPLQMMFQFVQHVNKLFLDIAVEPYVKLALDRGIVKGNESIFSSSRAVAARTVGLTLAMFGINGAPVGSDVGGNVTNSLREWWIATNGSDLPDEVWDVFQGGLINLMLNGMIDGKVDVTARISPSAAVDMVKGMFDDFSLDVLGAAGGITGTVFDIGSAVKAIWTTPDLTTQEQVMTTLKETASFFSGFKDYEKAQIAKAWLSHPYASTLSGPLRVTYEEAIFSYFSVNSKMVEDLYRNMDYRGSADRSQAEKVSRIMVRQLNRELTEYKEAGKLDYFKILELTEKWSNAAKAHLEAGQQEDVHHYFDLFMLKEGGAGFDNFIKPYIEGLSYENQRRKLRRLREEVQFEEYKEQVDMMLFYMENL